MRSVRDLAKIADIANEIMLKGARTALAALGRTLDTLGLKLMRRKLIYFDSLRSRKKGLTGRPNGIRLKA
jgi:hypothetical protein